MTKGKDLSEAKGMNQLAELFSAMSQDLRIAKHLKSSPQQGAYTVDTMFSFLNKR